MTLKGLLVQLLKEYNKLMYIKLFLLLQVFHLVRLPEINILADLITFADESL